MKVVQSSSILEFTCYDNNQVWTDEDCKMMRKKYNVFFDKNGVFACRVIPKKNGDGNPLLQVVPEDDGCIRFEIGFNAGFVFDAGWADNVIDVISAAEDFCFKDDEAKDVLKKEET